MSISTKRLVVVAISVFALIASSAQAAPRHEYTTAYWTVAHHISKHKAGVNIRRHGVPPSMRPARAGDYKRETKRLRRVIVAATPSFTTVIASWYGPGFYGGRTACGQTMSTGLQGVAHKTLSCGTLVTLRSNGRQVTVPVVDRGPYVDGRTFDLTAATARSLGHQYTGPVDYRLGR